VSTDPSAFVFNCTAVDSVVARQHEILAVINKTGFSVLRGLLDPAKIQAVRQVLTGGFERSRDVFRTGPYRQGCPDYQRIDIGEFQSSSRLCRYFFRFPWNDNTDFQSISSVLMDVRQVFDGVIPLTGTRFRSTFVIQYPRGGGFMSRHNEQAVHSDKPPFVVYTPLTKRGIDYTTGGGYILGEGDSLLYIDEFSEPGDVVLYRGDYYHGVTTVDPEVPISLDTVNGRMMLTASVSDYVK
jgi:hypothetical protein